MKYLPYIAILVLLLIVLLQNQSCEDPEPEPIIRTDTLVVYKIIHDTVPGKPVYIRTKKDTVWLKQEENTPDSTYEGLLSQYKSLGDKHFSINTFRTDFHLQNDFGRLTCVHDISENKIVNSIIETSIVIPTEIITIEKEIPYKPKNQLYIGPSFTGNKYYPISGVYGSLLFKTKKDKIYQFSAGYAGQVEYQAGLYFKIRLKK